MSKSETDDISSENPDFNNFTNGVRKLIDISLNPKKSLKFRLKFDYPRTGHKKPGQTIRNNIELKLKEVGLDAYLNEIIRSRTYMHHEARSILEKIIKTAGISNDKVRKKVS